MIAEFATLKKLFAKFLFFVLATIIVAGVGLDAIPTINGQNNELITGVVAEIVTTANGNLTGFTLDDGSENRFQFSVTDETQFGLENEAGDRWVAQLADDPRQAAQQLIDHRERFAPITVTISTNDATVATDIVEARTSNLSTNLTYLFAAFLVGLIAIFIFVVWMIIKQRSLQQQLKTFRDTLN